MESRAKCGKNGYLMGYGAKYCNRFKSNYNNFNTAGKQWVKCTANCLKLRTRTIVNANRRCAAIKQKAFESHVGCYTSCGFCRIYRGNITPLYKTYDFKDFFSKTALAQVVSMARKCLFG
uniref:ShKT domain-containing protein n=1 Tax=Panagrellus redivivus TaxID=6233 RepID=A0A7E4V9R5_PANRE